MAFIILIAFTRLLIICHPFILKNLYFNLFSFRLFLSNLLTMVQDLCCVIISASGIAPASSRQRLQRTRYSTMSSFRASAFFFRMVFTLFSMVLRFFIAYLHKGVGAAVGSRPVPTNLGYLFFLWRMLSHKAPPPINATSTMAIMVFASILIKPPFRFLTAGDYLSRGSVISPLFSSFP